MEFQHLGQQHESSTVGDVETTLPAPRTCQAWRAIKCGSATSMSRGAMHIDGVWLRSPVSAIIVELDQRLLQIRVCHR